VLTTDLATRLELQREPLDLGSTVREPNDEQNHAGRIAVGAKAEAGERLVPLFEAARSERRRRQG
jgi:hypothetical protein